MALKLNADLGEGNATADAQIMPYVQLANIACAGHAGNRASMLHYLELTQRQGVGAGAHPSYPDRENFGRETMTLSDDEFSRSLSAQLKAFETLCDEQKIKPSHVKPHGALNHDLSKDMDRLNIFFKIIKETVSTSEIILLARHDFSAIEKLAATYGLHVLWEGFADRGYLPDGSLVPRKTDSRLKDMPNLPPALLEQEQSIKQAELFIKKDTFN